MLVLKRISVKKIIINEILTKRNFVPHERQIYQVNIEFFHPLKRKACSLASSHVNHLMIFYFLFWNYAYDIDYQ